MGGRISVVPSQDEILDLFGQYKDLNAAANLDKRRIHPGIEEEFSQIAEKRKSTPEDRAFHNHLEIARRIRLWQISTRERIQQMEDNPLWSEKGLSGASIDDFKRAPRTFVKTIQEVLCRPEDRVVIERDEDLDGALANIIIDPRRINNKLLENLGLTEFIPEKGLLQEEQLECRARAIPAIKEMLKHIEPIHLPSEAAQPKDQRRYFRAMLITDGPNKGHILGTQYIDGKKRLFKTNLPNASRRLLNIEASYEAEIETLTWIEFNLNRVLDGLKDWNNLKANKTELDTLREALCKSVNILAHSSDKTKKNLKSQMEKCTKLKDSLGRDNPMAMRKALEKALRYIARRHQSIENIWRYIGQDKAKIKEIYSSQELPVTSFLEQVETMHDKFRLLRSELDLEEEEKAPVREALENIKSNVGAGFVTDRSLGLEVYRKAEAALSALETDNFDDLMQAYAELLSIPRPNIPLPAQPLFDQLRACAPTPMYLQVHEPHKSAIIANLTQREGDLAYVNHQPYSAFAAGIGTKIASTKEAVKDGNANTAAEEFVKVYIMSKLYRAFVGINDVHNKLSSFSKQTDPRALYEQLESIHSELSTRFVAPTVITQEFNAAFGQLYHLLNSLKKRLRELMGLQKPEVPKTEKRKESKIDSLESIMIELAEKAPRLTGLTKRARGVLDIMRDVRNKVERQTTAVTRAWAARKAEEKSPSPAPAFTEDEKLETYALMKDRIKEVDFEKLFCLAA